MTESAFSLDHYSYDLPGGLIASEPASPRDSSKLLVHDTRSDVLSDATFRDLDRYIPRGSVLVLNETKVVPARIVLSKATGGKVEILFYTNLWDGRSDILTGISDRKLTPGDRLYKDKVETCAVSAQDENLFTFKLSVSPTELVSLLEKDGVTPLPKYIKNSALTENERRKKYQTVFARNAGSVAAPTASLHLTPELLGKLEKNGVEIVYLTLHVGAGTFAPLTEHELRSGALHEESFIIPKETLAAIAKAKKEGRPVIPVGTTALRAIESIGIPQGVSSDIKSRTRIFIRKPYTFAVADGLITNFHVPRSSLMCLVDAFLDFKDSPKEILDLYRHAIERKYRFYSFGDGMLIL